MTIGKREILFQAHSQDLLELGCSKDRFFCPICGQSYSRENIEYDLTIGHVWPKLFRESNKTLNKYQVLLCKYCNSMIGASGDAQMQLAEKYKEAERSGELGYRKVRLIIPGRDQTIRLSADIHRIGESNARLSFSVRRNNPAEVVAFKAMADSNQKFNLIVEPPHLIRTEVAKSGWITASYLFAFYTFGYRYLFNEYMEPVRKYIWDTLRSDAVALPDSVRVGEYKNPQIYFSEPQIEINIPLNSPDPIHLEIKMARYLISLPLSVNPTATGYLLQSVVPQIFSEDGSVKGDISPDTFLGINVKCTKTVSHECIWDFVLGKPI